MRRIYAFLLLTGLLNPTDSHAQDSLTTVKKSTPKQNKVSPLVMPDAYRGKQTVVGSGGGFTGLTTTYFLLENGVLFSKSSAAKSYVYVGKQTPENTKRVFSVVEDKCAIRTTTFNQPGNLYKFVGWRKGREKHTVTWGAIGKPVSENYPRFYDAFMAMLPSATLPRKK